MYLLDGEYGTNGGRNRVSNLQKLVDVPVLKLHRSVFYQVIGAILHKTLGPNQRKMIWVKSRDITHSLQG